MYIWRLGQLQSGTYTTYYVNLPTRYIQNHINSYLYHASILSYFCVKNQVRLISSVLLFALLGSADVASVVIRGRRVGRDPRQIIYHISQNSLYKQLNHVPCCVMLSS